MHSLSILTLALALLVPVAEGGERAQDDIVATAVKAGSFKTLAAALKAGGLIETLQGDGPFTVFAPTDAAFAKLPKGTVAALLDPANRSKLVALLKYHVVVGSVPAVKVMKLRDVRTALRQRVDITTSDSGVAVDRANVVQADIGCRNGIIHVIDTVLLPESKTIPAVAAKAGTFQTLLAAVQTAGLADVLSGKGPFTVLAPNDAAFAKLPKGTVASLLKPKNRAKLVAILKHHVVSGRAYSEDVLKAQSIPTLLGTKIEIRTKNGVAFAGHAKIVATDIDASNGVVHVIDAVLIPTTEG